MHHKNGYIFPSICNLFIGRFESQVLKTDHVILFWIHCQWWVFTFPVEAKYCPGDKSTVGSSWIHCSFVCFIFFQCLQDVQALVSFAQSSKLKKQLFLVSLQVGAEVASTPGFGDEVWGWGLNLLTGKLKVTLRENCYSSLIHVHHKEVLFH